MKDKTDRLLRPLIRIWIVMALALPLAAAAQERDFSKIEIETIKVTDNIYVLREGGGNVTVFTGEDGAIVIDDKFAPLTEKIMAAIRDFTDQPVRFVINTHWHPDHTGGNENMGEAGALVIAHDNVHARLLRDNYSQLFDQVTPASPADVPVVTFSESVTFHLNGEHVRADHIAAAHTDGDTVIHFPDSNVLVSGDIVFAGMYPFIDVCTGGDIEGVIAAQDWFLKIGNRDTRIVPGHGPVIDKAQLLTYRNMLNMIRDRVAGAIEEGMTLDDAMAAGLTDDLDEKWATPFVGQAKIVKYAYLSLAGVDQAVHCPVE